MDVERFLSALAELIEEVAGVSLALVGYEVSETDLRDRLNAMGLLFKHVTTDLHVAAKWRNEPDRHPNIIALATGRYPGVSTLAHFPQGNARTLATRLLEWAQTRQAALASTPAQERLLAELAEVRALSPLMSLNGVSQFLATWKAGQAVDALDAPRRALPRLGVLPDRKLFGVTDEIAERLAKNFRVTQKLAKMPGQGLEAIRKRILRSQSARRDRRLEILARVEEMRRTGGFDTFQRARLRGRSGNRHPAEGRSGAGSAARPGGGAGRRRAAGRRAERAGRLARGGRGASRRGRAGAAGHHRRCRRGARRCDRGRRGGGRRRVCRQGQRTPVRIHGRSRAPDLGPALLQPRRLGRVLRDPERVAGSGAQRLRAMRSDPVAAVRGLDPALRREVRPPLDHRANAGRAARARHHDGGLLRTLGPHRECAPGGSGRPRLPAAPAGAGDRRETGAAGGDRRARAGLGAPLRPAGPASRRDARHRPRLDANAPRGPSRRWTSSRSGRGWMSGDRLGRRSCCRPIRCTCGVTREWPRSPVDWITRIRTARRCWSSSNDPSTISACSGFTSFPDGRGGSQPLPVARESSRARRLREPAQRLQRQRRDRGAATLRTAIRADLRQPYAAPAALPGQPAEGKRDAPGPAQGQSRTPESGSDAARGHLRDAGS